MLRKIIVLICFLALLSSCAKKESPQQIITIASTGQFLNATVYIDGKKIGQLQFLRLHGSWFQELLKKIHGPSPMDDAVALNIAIDPSISPGDHEVKVEKKGYKTFVEPFKWPPPGNEKSIFIYAIPEIDSSSQK